MYRGKTEKRFDVSLKQESVNIVAEILPPGNSDFMQHHIFGKTRAGEAIKDWESQECNSDYMDRTRNCLIV